MRRWSASAEFGFDKPYERDDNIFNPINQYRPDNPLNPINSRCGRSPPLWKCWNGRASVRSTTSTTYLTEFRRKNPRASIPETAFLEPCFLTKAENTIIDNMLEFLNKHGLTSHQSQHLLERLGGIMEMGQRLPKGGGSCDPRPSAHHVRGLHGKRKLGKRVREVAAPIAGERRSTATSSADSRERPPHRSVRPR